MMKIIVLSTLSCILLLASAPTPLSMASDLNLSTGQIKQLQRIDAAVEQVERYSRIKRIVVLTPKQRELYFARHTSLYENN